MKNKTSLVGTWGDSDDLVVICATSSMNRKRGLRKESAGGEVIDQHACFTGCSCNRAGRLLYRASVTGGVILGDNYPDSHLPF